MPHVVGEHTLLSITEAHQQSGLSQTHIGLLLRQGKIEGFKVGSIWLLYADSLARFMQTPRKPGPKGPRLKRSSESTSD